MSDQDRVPADDMPPPNPDAQRPLRVQQRRGAAVWILVIALFVVFAVVILVLR